MHRIAGDGVAANLHGPGLSGFTEGDPATSTPATVVTDDWLNAVQEEIAHVIEPVMPLNAAASYQLQSAIAFPLGLLSATTLAKVIDGPCGMRAVAQATRGFRVWHLIDATGKLRLASGALATVSAIVDFNAIAYSEPLNLFAAVGDTGEIQTGEIGWTHRTQANAYAGSWRGVVAGPARFVAVGDDNEIQTSDDGLTWTKRVSALAVDTHLVRVTYSPSARAFLILGAVAGTGERTRMQTSPDGITWTAATAPVWAEPSALSVEIGPAPGGFVAILAGGAYKAAESESGGGWTVVDMFPNGEFSADTVAPNGWLLRNDYRVALSPHHPPFPVAGHVASLTTLRRTQTHWYAANSAGDVYRSIGLPY